jgi:isochorismate hydrolase
MKGKGARAYLEGFGTVRSVLELDALTAKEIVEALDPERDDLLLNPWKRGYNAAIRSALGH